MSRENPRIWKCENCNAILHFDITSASPIALCDKCSANEVVETFDINKTGESSAVEEIIDKEIGAEVTIWNEDHVWHGWPATIDNKKHKFVRVEVTPVLNPAIKNHRKWKMWMPNEWVK
tara:strand:+ start:992 stop:1348 length:357 start_codon:yes stop_codon:yes gene_type:complete